MCCRGGGNSERTASKDQEAPKHPRQNHRWEDEQGLHVPSITISEEVLKRCCSKFKEVLSAGRDCVGEPVISSFSCSGSEQQSLCIIQHPLLCVLLVFEGYDPPTSTPICGPAECCVTVIPANVLVIDRPIVKKLKLVCSFLKKGVSWTKASSWTIPRR